MHINTHLTIFNGKEVKPSVGRSGNVQWLDLKDRHDNTYITIFFGSMDDLKELVDELMSSLIDLDDPGLMVLAGRGKGRRC